MATHNMTLSRHRPLERQQQLTGPASTDFHNIEVDGVALFNG